MATTRAHLGLTHLTDAELAAAGHTLSAGLTANAALYPHPPFDATTLAAASDELTTKAAAKAQHDAAGVQLTADLNATRAKLRQQYTGDAKYAEALAGGDEAKLRLAGLVPQAKGAHHAVLPTPAGLSAVLSDVLGEVRLHWHAPRTTAVINVRVEMTTDPTKPETFHQVALETKSHATISNLVHGSTVTFRVVFLGAGGTESTPSGSATLTV